MLPSNALIGACHDSSSWMPCRPLKWAQRDRSSALRQAHDPLLAHVTDRLLERLEDCVSKFPSALVIGGAGKLQKCNIAMATGKGS